MASMRALLLVVTACSAPASAPPSNTLPVERVAGVEILVENAAGANDLVVTADYLYWIGGSDLEHAIVRAAHVPGAEPTILHDAKEANHLVLTGEQLVWVEQGHQLHSIPRAGGAAARLAFLKDAVWSMIDVRGLVVGAYNPADHGDARVIRVTETGDVSELVKLPGSETPFVAADARGQLWVACASGYSNRPQVLGRIVGGRLEQLREASGAQLIAVEDETLYASIRGDDSVDTLVKITAGRDPLELVRNTSGLITALALDDSYVYWAVYDAQRGGKLWRMPKRGGTPEALADMGETTRLVLHGAYVYWADSRKNRVARLRRELTRAGDRGSRAASSSR